jgi:hypothetical protein
MPKHHKHIVEKWRRVAENIENSALSAIEYCKKNKISVKSFYAWKTKLRKLDSNKSCIKNQFQELKLKEPPAAAFTPAVVPENIEIFFNDKIRISVAANFDESLLLKTIKVLDKALC